MGSLFPYGTLLINLSGCFLLGLIGQLHVEPVLVSADMRMAIAVGFFAVHHIFQFWLGDRENVGRRRMASRHNLRWSKRVCGLAFVRRGIRLANKF